GRKYSGSFEALYVGKASKLSSRINGQLNNLRLVDHVRNSRNGHRLLVFATVRFKPGQPKSKVLKIVEKAFIKYFLSEGHDLVNKQGTRIRRHEIASRKKPQVLGVPGVVYVERGKGE